MMLQQTLRTPPAVMPMPFWPGAKRAIELAVSGAKEAPRIAVGGTFGDRSEIVLEYQLLRQYGVPDELYDQVGEPPLLRVLVADHGVGISQVKGLTTRVRENEAERALREVRDLIGGESKAGAVIFSGLSETDTRHSYWFKVDA